MVSDGIEKSKDGFAQRDGAVENDERVVGKAVGFAKEQIARAFIQDTSVLTPENQIAIVMQVFVDWRLAMSVQRVGEIQAQRAADQVMNFCVGCVCGCSGCYLFTHSVIPG